jgi:hypothetical protein
MMLRACALLALAACGTLRAEADAPAVIIHPTADSRAALLRAVGAALDGAQVTLADDALTHESILLIERARRLDPSGLLANGRELGMPERFRLVKSGGQCVLVHERSGKRAVLAATECAPGP